MTAAPSPCGRTDPAGDAKLRAATDLPLWAKLTPNTGEIRRGGGSAEAGGADALVVANTILAMSVDIRTRRPTLGKVMGGLSGPAVKPIILQDGLSVRAIRSVFRSSVAAAS